MNNQYFEGILQLRNPIQKAVDFIRAAVDKRNDVFIAKEVKIKKGIDFYMSSQKFLQILGKKLQKRFGGEYKISRKLFGINKLTSKMIYRVNVLVRLSKFRIGQTIDYRGKKIKIVGLRDKIQGIDVKSGKKILIKYTDVN